MMPKNPSVLAYHECCLMSCLRRDPVCETIKEEAGIKGGITLMDVSPKKGGGVGSLVIVIEEGGTLCEKEVQLGVDTINKLLTKVLLLTAGGKCLGCCPDNRSNHCLQALGKAKGLL